MKPADLIRTLAERFPVFVAEGWQEHKPLAVGIHEALAAAGLLQPGEVAIALRCYAGRRRYLAAVAAGGVRFDLDGNPAGEVTEQQATWARGRLARLDAAATKEPATRAQQAAREAQQAIEARAWVEARQAQRVAAEGRAEAPPPRTPVAEETRPRPSAEAPRRLSLGDLREAARARRDSISLTVGNAPAAKVSQTHDAYPDRR
jgi:ProP effector